MKKLLTLLLVLIMLACGKDSPKPPEAAMLSFPTQNSECTTGISLNNTTSQVEFRWLAAKHADSYQLKFTNVLNNTSVTNAPTEALSVRVPLLKGVPYQWTITTSNSETQEIAISEAWFFYNAGSQTTFPPFPAQIISPNSGASVERDLNNEITLDWTGADVDNDIDSYEVYLDTVTNPQLLISSPSLNITNIKASVDTDTIYYWRVVTIDRAGNTSDSGTYSFRVIG
ncbi:hypothetical protein [uncultured Muriicola sp.]|uniref:hypothetical protein n=1 Tax=uncultured Muriicola sp. TaxID=1583102 RepID=UPI00261F0C5D|nr:hypothetical protein [uncultured Muriicola sp.]